MSDGSARPLAGEGGAGGDEVGGFRISTVTSLRSVRARAMHADQIVAVGDVQRRVRVLVTRERLVPTDDPA